jgi:competence/damage-inducible protein CinA-like protein
MPTAEIITIGTEILLGEIVDTNAQSIARKLADLGVDLYRKTTVGDNPRRIAAAIRQALTSCNFVLTTGGLGPTVDDPTREAVAMAYEVELEYIPELWEQIQARFARFGRQATENNRRQAYIPKGALPVENPVGTAPAFIFEQGMQSVISLPGVPSEMEYLMENAIIPYLQKRYQLHGTIRIRLLHTAGVGESQIDELISDLETLDNPTIGLAAHSGQVDIRIAAKADSLDEAERLITPLETEIRKRLGAWLYGVDGETLENVALRRLSELGWTLRLVLDGQISQLAQSLSRLSGPFLGAQLLATSADPESVRDHLLSDLKEHAADIGMGIAIVPKENRQEIFMILITPAGEERIIHPYGGPPQYAARWASNHALNILRNLSLKQIE